MSAALWPDLSGQVCLLADASSPAGRLVHENLLRAGATVVALHHRAARTSAGIGRFMAGTDTVAALIDLDDPGQTADALTWALTRTQRLDLAVLTNDGRPSARMALAALAAEQLRFTHRFQPESERLPLLLYLARPGDQSVTQLKSALAGAALTEPVSAVLVDYWPDAAASAAAAVEYLLSDADQFAARPLVAGLHRFDPTRGRAESPLIQITPDEASKS